MSLADLGPFRLPPEDAVYEPALREALVQELYDRSVASLLALVPVLLILSAIFDFPWIEVPGLIWAFAFLSAVLCARFALLAWIRMEPGRMSLQAKSWAFMVGAVMVASGFAAMNWIAWPRLGTAQVGLLVITHAGINATALTSLAPNAWAYMAYMGLDVLSLILLVATKGGMGHYDRVLLMLLGTYLAALTVLAIQSHRSLAAKTLAGLKLKDLSLRDTLTGLRNRRFLMEFMGPESESVLRSWVQGSPVQQSFAILILDLDHFKSVNDQHGHPAGDAVLKQAAAVLAETMRKQDLVIRWGGEEFVIVARGADRGYALTLAERVRERIGSQVFTLPGGAEIRKTCSIGYSLFPFAPDQPDLLDWEQCLALADACLYRAKAGGRDRAIGAFPGNRSWDTDPRARLAEVERDLGEASRTGFVRLMGELH